MINDYFVFAINSIKHRKLRSWLTILGIIIGVAAIVALISLSLGVQEAIREQFESFGINRILITSKGFQGPGTVSEGITEKDVDTIEQMSDFDFVTPVLFRTAEIKKRGEIAFTSVRAMPASEVEKAFSDISIELERGRFFRSGEKFSAVLGSRAAKELFDDELRLRNSIEIEKEGFKIVGIFEEQGNQQDDNSIFIPLEAAREIFNEPDHVDVIIARVKTGGNIELLQEKVKDRLKRARDDENFQVITATQIAEQINSILGGLAGVLIVIALISLIVGGIGIMNSMYTSVLERTRDIGVMKAVGATNGNVLSIFLMEAGILGMMGGVIGSALGIIIGKIVEVVFKNIGLFPLRVGINAYIILFGIGFAFFVGMISGFLPARQAAKLKPVDALRYE